MKKPNFFIIGAPKCGTTSLAAWLADHPNIYMSPVKEPHFFDTDLAKRAVFTNKNYQRLFAAADDRHIAIGEASTWYLFSEVAIPNILQYAPGARFIAMFRNPVDMAHALHEEEIISGNESVPDFRQAWSLQSHRERHFSIPSTCVEPTKLQYGKACLLGRQVRRLLIRVPREKTHFIVLDDVKDNPRQEYRRALDFLKLPDDGRNDFPIKNSAKRPRSALMQRLLRRGSDFKKMIGIYRSFGLNTLNVEFGDRRALDSEFRTELTRYFSADVRTLEKELDRDLSSWLV